MGNGLRWGFLGTGNIARQFAAGIRDSSRARLTAVGSRQAERAARFIADCAPGGAKAGDYDSVIGADDVDAVYVALPNSMHHDWTIKALRAGKHVLCEKPLATNREQAEEMFDVASQTGRTLVEAFMYRCHPQSHAVIKAVREGAVGELRLIRTSFSFQTRKPQGNVRFDASLAGGSLMDVGCYCIDFSRWIAGAEPTAVHAFGRLHPSGIDEVVSGNMLFPENVLATFNCGLGAQADNSAFICGTEGYIQIPVPWKPGGRNARYAIHRQPPPLSDAMAESGARRVSEEFAVEPNKELYALEVDAFTATVLDGRPACVTSADSLANMAILDELRRQLGVQVEA